MNQYKEFSASLGVSAMLTTFVVTVILVSISAFTIIRLVPPFELVNVVIAGFVVVGIFTLYSLVYLLSPSKYIMDHEKITVKRRLKSVKIYFSEMTDVLAVNKHTMTDLKRIGGSAGVFGFFGEFETRFGSTTFYATRLDKFILIKTAADEKIVLTPDNMAMYYELKDALNTRADRSPLNLVE